VRIRAQVENGLQHLAMNQREQFAGGPGRCKLDRRIDWAISSRFKTLSRTALMRRSPACEV